ncbi:MAG: HAD hydrolase-like protein, partial [bacterium]|nr:HAD hydrolase-like protein [bacterium]
MDFSKYEICCFDCYGTLIDWERGIIASLKPVLSKYGITAEDEKILELYSAAETEAESEVYRPYKDILATIVTTLGNNLEFTPSKEDKDAICGSIKYWRPFPDTVDALKKLKSNYKLAVISNIDDDLFEYSAEKLQVEF